jgi:hypothetical protein
MAGFDYFKRLKALIREERKRREKVNEILSKDYRKQK